MFFLFAAVACTLASCAGVSNVPPRGETMRVAIVEKNKPLQTSEPSTPHDLHEVPLEQYVAGVLDREVRGDWPLEALKAQAVATRTYALYRKDNPRHATFDVFSDTTDQVFEKKRNYPPAIVKAVLETEGQVLTSEGKIMQAFFHSCCGGRSERADRVWRGVTGVNAPPLLQIHDDPYCKSCPPAHWAYRLKHGELVSSLKSAGFAVDDDAVFATGAREESGRASEILVTSGRGRIVIPATDVRRVVGYEKIKSTFFDVTTPPTAGDIVFEGRGSGHGVGLCQWGAKAMADSGIKYQDILNFYYPGAAMVASDTVESTKRLSHADGNKIRPEDFLKGSGDDLLR